MSRVVGVLLVVLFIISALLLMLAISLPAVELYFFPVSSVTSAVGSPTELARPVQTALPIITAEPTAAPPTMAPPATAAPTVVVPIATVPSTAVAASSPKIQGLWRFITTADGLCTDWPLFIGGEFIGTGTQTICSSRSNFALDVPQGTRVTAANRFPPGGGIMAATDAGVCTQAFGEWQCQAYSDTFPYRGIHGIVPLGPDPVYMLEDAVVYHDRVYSLPALTGAADARPTWMAASGEIFAAGLPAPEIWVGTNHYGLVVISAETGESRRCTTEDGLPSNVIRDVLPEYCPKPCQYRNAWVATDAGVAHWDGAQWKAYTTADGLPSADVRGVTWGADGTTLWAATAKGAAYLDQGAWLAYTAADGLPEEDLTGASGYQGATVAFGTRGKGLLIFTAAGRQP